MKKYFTFLILVLSLVVFTQVAFAQAPADSATSQVLDGLGVTADNADIDKTEGSLGGFVGRVINFSFSAIAAIFVTVIMVGGYLWMTARGNEEKVAKAKTFILNGLFGMTVVFLVYGLVYVILFALGEAIAG